MGLAAINIKFTCDLKQFSSEMQTAMRSVQKVGKDFQKVGTALSIGITAPVVAFGVASVNAFDESSKAIAQVDAALKSTGGTVGFNSEQLQKMAAELQNVTTFDDDQILKQATANLLTFNKVTGNTFVQAQKAALDLATRLDGDLQTATLQIGKALQDPVKGITALSKAGVSFSADQKAVIKQMVATNDIAGAQSLILKELNKEFGGSAEAAAKAGTGPFKQLKNQIGDLSEEFGKIIVDALLPFIEKLRGAVTYLQQLSPEAKKTIAVIAGIAAVLGPLALSIGTVLSLVPNMVVGFKAISSAFSALTAVITANPIGALAIAIGAVLGAFLLFNRESKETVKTQSLINELDKEATQLVAGHIVKINDLVATAKNETASKKERIAAIKELNKISPEYLGNLSIENINTEAATKSLDKYNTALLNAAKAKIASNKIKELTDKQAAADIDAIVNAKEIANAREKINAVNKNIVKTLDNLGEVQKQKTNEQIEQYKKIYEQYKPFLKLLDDIFKTESSNNDTLIKQREKLNEVTTAITPALSTGTADAYDREIAKLEEFKNSIANTPALVEAAKKRIEALEFQKALKLDPSSVIKTTESIDDLNKRLQGTAAGMSTMAKGLSIDMKAFYQDVNSAVQSSVGTIAEGLAGAIGSAISGSSNLFKTFSGLIFSTFGDLLINLGKIAIKAALTTLAIKESLTTLNPAIALVAGFAAIAFGTAIKSQVSNLGAFANGGIVGGTSFYGDKILARVNSGELIMSQKQQKALYGQLNTGSGTNIILGAGWELSGDTLRLLLDRNDKKRNRLG